MSLKQAAAQKLVFVLWLIAIFFHQFQTEMIASLVKLQSKAQIATKFRAIHLGCFFVLLEDLFDSKHDTVLVLYGNLKNVSEASKKLDSEHRFGESIQRFTRIHIGRLGTYNRRRKKCRWSEEGERNKKGRTRRRRSLLQRRSRTKRRKQKRIRRRRQNLRMLRKRKRRRSRITRSTRRLIRASQSAMRRKGR